MRVFYGRIFLMKQLIIKAKYKINDEDTFSEVRVPYILSSEQKLPDIYPFNQNVYFGPDLGAFLGVLYIDEIGRINYLDKLIELNEGTTIFSPFKTEKYIFEFKVEGEDI